ncbi:MAG: PqqD family protein [Pseudomonadota bacterium]
MARTAGNAKGDPATSALDTIRPVRGANPDAHAVGDELVLVPGGDADVFALNATGRAIWELCDGTRSLRDILDTLKEKFEGDDVDILADMTAALFQLRSLGLLDENSLLSPDQVVSAGVPGSAPKRRVRIVHGIEDNTYFRWQLAIMFESLVGQLPAGWSISIVVCNNHQPISSELAHILETYDVACYTGEAHADNHHIDFAGGGDHYVPMNRVEALNVIAGHVQPDELVVLMDTDIFLYGDLQPDLFPDGDAMAANWIIGQERYFQFATKDETGLSLPKLLDAMGIEETFKPGGVMVFLTGATLQANDRKVVRDAFRFLQILRLMGQIMELPPHGSWVAEMACYALAMYPSGIDYELLDIEQFAVQEQHAKDLPEGSFYHYYTDINDGSDGPFFESQWHKQLYRESDFLEADIDSYHANAVGAVERSFMAVAKRARERLHG